MGVIHKIRVIAHVTLPLQSEQGNGERKAKITTFGDVHLQEVRGSLKDKAKEKEKQSHRQEEIRPRHDRSQRQRQRRQSTGGTVRRGVKAEDCEKGCPEEVWAAASNHQARAEAGLQEVGVSGREEVEVTSLSDSRSLVVRKKRNKVFVQNSSKEKGPF